MSPLLFGANNHDDGIATSRRALRSPIDITSDVKKGRWRQRLRCRRHRQRDGSDHDKAHDHDGPRHITVLGRKGVTRSYKRRLGVCQARPTIGQHVEHADAAPQPTRHP